MHVIEFHMSYLHVHPPPGGFPRTTWLLKKLKRTMAKERPEGRKRRPGLPGTKMEVILTTIWNMVTNPTTATRPLRKLYANVGAALAFAFEQAMRIGNVCQGVTWRGDWHLSRGTIAPVLCGQDELRRTGKAAVVVQAPVSKTTHTNDAARERTNRPRVFDIHCDKSYSFVKWGALLHEVDPVLFGDDAQAGYVEHPGNVPAFRLGGAHSPALSYSQVCGVMKKVAKAVLPDFEKWDMGGHSCRIGRINDLLHCTDSTGRQLATEEQMNSFSMHTSSAGRESYDRAAVAAELRLMRAAESVEYTPIETVQKFPQHRGEERDTVFVDETVACMVDGKTDREPDPLEEPASDGRDPSQEQGQAERNGTTPAPTDSIDMDAIDMEAAIRNTKTFTDIDDTAKAGSSVTADADFRAVVDKLWAAGVRSLQKTEQTTEEELRRILGDRFRALPAQLRQKAAEHRHWLTVAAQRLPARDGSEDAPPPPKRQKKATKNAAATAAPAATARTAAAAVPAASFQAAPAVLQCLLLDSHDGTAGHPVSAVRRLCTDSGWMLAADVAEPDAHAVHGRRSEVGPGIGHTVSGNIRRHD